MHDTVAKIKKEVRSGITRDSVADTVSKRLQGGGLTRALSEPLASQLELLYRDALHWLRLLERAIGGGEDAKGSFAEIHFTSRRLGSILADLIPFLERAEDNLSEKEETTHRESGYEREVAPFSRLDSTQAFRTFLTDHPAFGPALAGTGAQVEADLLKVIYLESRLEDQIPKTTDLYAMAVELLLDARRHLVPAFAEGAPFLKSLERAAGV